MRKTLFMALCLIGIMSLFSVETKAQQYQTTLVSTVASFKDTTKNYTYTNVYAVVQSTSFSRSGMGMMAANQDSASFKKWNMNYTVSVYSNEAAYREGKQSISYWSGNILLTQSFPTEAEILTAIKNHLPK